MAANEGDEERTLKPAVRRKPVPEPKRSVLVPLPTTMAELSAAESKDPFLANTQRAREKRTRGGPNSWNRNS